MIVLTTGARVMAVIVTYGDRGALVSASATAALEAGVDFLTIVDNASATALNELVDALSRAFPAAGVTCIRNDRNLGSAGGFAAGVREFTRSDADFLLLLDDDNVVPAKAVEHLRDFVSTEGLEHTLAFRPQRPRQLWALGLGGQPYPAPDAFMYFDAAGKFFPRRASGFGSGIVPYAPYGGMFLSRSVLDRGEPDARFVLYEDDTEFSLRVLGPTRLCSSVQVEDIDSNWLSTHRSTHGPIRLVFGGRRDLTYVSARNRVFVERSYLVRSRPRYFLNAVFFLFFIASHVRGRSDAADLLAFLRGVWAGLRSDPEKFQVVELPGAYSSRGGER